MRTYEIMFVVRPDLEEEKVAALVERFQGIVTDNGATITETKDMGKRELAYEIKNYKNGHYFLFVTEAETADANNEFDRLALISEDIIRHIIVKIEE